MAKQKVIRWNNDGEDSEHDGDCAEGASGDDATLCGDALDGDTMTVGTYELAYGPVTCPRCVQIIQHCKKLKI